MSAMIEERFDLEYVNRLSAIFNAARPDGVSRVLFNYTRRGALKYLIGPDGDISCAHSLWQNDPAEVMLGVWLFGRFLMDGVGYPAGHVGALVQHLFLNIERSRRVGAGEFFPATPYIFCLSGNEDYLYFWSEYMKDANGDASAGGFSVGLDHRRLQAAIKDANAASGGCRFLLLPCLYAGVDDASIADFFRAAYDHHRRSFDEFAAERDPLAHPSAAVMGVMLFAATIIKGGQWAQEHEHRLVLFPKFEDRPDVSSGKPRIRSGLFARCRPDLSDVVKCIWFSPQGNQDGLLLEVRECLDGVGSAMRGDEQMAETRTFFMRSRCHLRKIGDEYVEGVSRRPNSGVPNGKFIAF